MWEPEDKFAAIDHFAKTNHFCPSPLNGQTVEDFVEFIETKYGLVTSYFTLRGLDPML